RQRQRPRQRHRAGEAHRRERAADEFRRDARAATHRRERSGERLHRRVDDGWHRWQQRRGPGAIEGLFGETRQAGASRMTAGEARDVKAGAAPLRQVKLAPAEVSIERKPDGTIYMRSPHPLGPYPDKLTERLEHWAKTTPDRIFLAQRAPDGSWRKLSYAQ